MLSIPPLNPEEPSSLAKKQPYISAAGVVANKYILLPVVVPVGYVDPPSDPCRRSRYIESQGFSSRQLWVPVSSGVAIEVDF